MGELIESLITADNQRHGQTHQRIHITLRSHGESYWKMSSWHCNNLSSIVQRQFTSTNPYSKIALSFISLSVQLKIQRRQLRMDHPATTALCYLNILEGGWNKIGINRLLLQRQIENSSWRTRTCCFHWCEDAWVLLTSSTLVALDYDMHKASLTPAIVLECEVPDRSEKSFVRGKVSISAIDCFSGKWSFLTRSYYLWDFAGERLIAT